RHAAIRQAAHADRAVDDLQIRGSDLQHVRADGEDLLPERAAGAQDGGPGVGGDAAGEAADAVGDRAGVARDHVDVLEAHAHRIGRDLRERRLVALALRRRAARYDHAATTVEP